MRTLLTVNLASLVCAAPGIMGAFSFFFSANYCRVDSPVDDGGPDMRKYRRIGIVGSVCVWRRG